jgi:hypothetical protein
MDKKKKTWMFIGIGALILIVIAAYFLVSATIIGSKCQGYCTSDAQTLLGAKQTCESGLGTTLDPKAWGVVCSISYQSSGGGCINCHECQYNYCSLPGSCENGFKHYTCTNQCTGATTEKQYACTQSCDWPYHTCNDGSCAIICTGDSSPADKCSSDAQCNDNDPSTLDACVKIGQIAGVGGHYECQYTTIPYYADKVACAAQPYFGIANSHEWVENPTQQCWIPGLLGTGLFCKTVSQPFCQLKPDYVIGSGVAILVVIVLFVLLLVGIIRGKRRR